MLKRIKGWSDVVGRRGENIYGSMGNDFEKFVQAQTENGKKGLLEDPNFARLDDKNSYLVSCYNLTA